MKRLALAALGISALTFYGCGGGGLAEPDVHYRDFGVNVAVRSSPYLTKENHPDGWGKGNCLECHQNFKHTMATPKYPVDAYQALIENAVKAVGTSNAIMVCSACHGTNGVSEVNGKPVERKCLVCHDSIDELHFYKGTSSRKQSFHDFNGNGKLDDGDCVVCHWQPDMDGIVEPDTDFGAPGGIQPKTVEDLCLSCHSGNDVFKNPVADTNGDGKADKVMTPPKEAPNIGTAWNTTDWHGANSYTAGDKQFKDITLSGELLFHTAHSPLACSQCHNPHASNNDKLIIERVGETLLSEKLIKQVDNTTEVKYALIDPQTTAYFKDMAFTGKVEAKDRTYDLSNPQDLKDYLYLPVKNLDSVDVKTEREYTSSLCAACHDGTISYSPVNGLGLPIDYTTHMDPNGTCVSCHTHGKTF
ncbi:cytochrome c3 family protein [Thermovibrio sp.]